MRLFVAWKSLPLAPVLLALLVFCRPATAASSDPAAEFRKDVLPVLKEYCYDCHGDGMSKGGVAFDQLTNTAALLNHDLWSKALKNLRAGIMPPAKKPRPGPAEIRQLETWVKRDAFGLDPANPDPGRVTIRRLNRVEYRNTIRDLMDFDFKANEEFPPDDSGYGFDNIGDVLSVSPLLLEKYMHAAESIVAGAVPIVARTLPEKAIAGTEFKGADDLTGARISFYQAATVSYTAAIQVPGDYRIVVELDVNGQFDFDPGQCAASFRVEDDERWKGKFEWQNHKRFTTEFTENWDAGKHHLKFSVQPLVDASNKVNSLDMHLASVRIRGPLDPKKWTRSKNYDRYFSRESAPESQAGRRAYAREILNRFATRAFRRPVDDRTLGRLVTVAEITYSVPGKSFEEGITRAMVAVLSSPRFLFRLEATEPLQAGAATSRFPLIDEYALASRLSYFLWSTMPDEELFKLAETHSLRKNLDSQIKRMLADSRSDALVENFTGQWLQARDVDGIDINARAVLARDRGEEKDIQFSRKRFQELANKAELTPEEQRERQQLIDQRRRRFGNRQTIELDGPLRRAMREETELCFGYVMREDRSVLELIESGYTYLNERLAKHYGLTNLNVTGAQMRRVALPTNSVRGGILTEGTVLVVTSNPTRTSPVKRGLFLLDNILGTPTPPPPPDIPALEDSEKDVKGHEPTLREILAIHREKPLCSSCHNRMDPLGLALENFNALGMWREKERGQGIDAAGKLITGEDFASVRELKHILAVERRSDFYRCLTEKLMIYALGRGLEYYDTEAVDRVVAGLEQNKGRFSTLLRGVIDSAPFQKRRTFSATAAAASSSENVGQEKPKS